MWEVTDADRLSALDTAFLEIERGGAHMHIGALAIFDGGELVSDEGAVDFARIRAHVEGAMERLPRYRQRLAKVPGLATMAWTDDDHFRLDYHVRHTALPRPGDERQLKRLAGRIFSGRLDRDRPLWELWVIEGLADGGFALVMKTHHCLVDGMGGVELLSGLFGPEARAAGAWEPQEEPSRLELVEHELAHRARSARATAETLREMATHPGETLRSVRESLHQTTELVKDGLTPCDRTLLNPEQVGPHRRFDVLDFDLGAVKAVKKALGGKINDVVLATAAGGLGRYLRRRGVDVEGLTDFRALVPVDVRHGRSGVGNRVGMMFARLPLAEDDPRARYRRVLAATERLKTEAGHARATELVEDLSDWAAPSLVGDLFRYTGVIGTFNVVITNVPGPPFEMSLLGAPLRALYPLVPLFKTQAVGMALFSYAGGLYWGLNADWSIVGDLHLLVEDLRASFDELRAVASETTAP